MASEPVPSRYSTDSARTSFEGRDAGEGGLLSSSPSWRLGRSLSGVLSGCLGLKDMAFPDLAPGALVCMRRSEQLGFG